MCSSPHCFFVASGNVSKITLGNALGKGLSNSFGASWGMFSGTPREQLRGMPRGTVWGMPRRMPSGTPQEHFITSTIDKRTTATKPGKIIAQSWVPHPPYHMNFWPWITYQIKNLLSNFHGSNDHQNWQGGDGGPHSRRDKNFKRRGLVTN